MNREDLKKRVISAVSNSCGARAAGKLTYAETNQIGEAIYKELAFRGLLTDAEPMPHDKPGES